MVMVRKRIELEDPLYEIMTILELPVWLGIMATLFFTTFLVWIFHCCSPYSGRNDQKDVKCKQFTVMESFWFTIDCLLPQGPEETPKNMSGRIVGVTWWLFGFLVIASYTANLAAYLKVSHGGHIPDIESLAEQSRIKYAVVKGSAAEVYFERMSDIEEKARNSWKYVPGDSSMSPLERLKATTFDHQISNTYTNLWQSMQETGLPRNLTDGIERVLQSDSKEKFVFIDHSDVLEYFALTDCRLEVIGKRFFRGSYGIAVQANSGLSEIFNKLIIKMQNQKVLEILWNKWWNNNPNRLDCNRDNEAAAVEKFGKFFELIIICTSVLAFLLLLEFIYFKLKLIKCGKVADVSSSVKKRHIIIMGQSANRV